MCLKTRQSVCFKCISNILGPMHWQMVGNSSDTKFILIQKVLLKIQQNIFHYSELFLRSVHCITDVMKTSIN